MTKQTRIIIRIENQRGYGIFRGDWISYPIERSLIIDRHFEFNTPQQDGLDMEKDNEPWYCGYHNLKSFRSWITYKEIKAIIYEGGFKVFKIKVTDYQKGKHQYIFTKKSIVYKEDITTKILNNKY